MYVERSLAINASPESVWNILADIRGWPEWTTSVKSIEPDGSGLLAAGLAATVRQPKLPAARWTVTDVQPGESFDWESRARGLYSIARHHVRPTPSGCEVTLSIEQTGFAEPVARLFYGRLTRRYLETEAAGLKRRAESLAHRDAKS